MERFFEKAAPKNRVVLLVIMDIFTIQLASFMGLFLRYDFSIAAIPTRYLDQICYYTAFNTCISIAVFILCKLYRSVWHFASTTELLNIIIACTIATVLMFTGTKLMKYQLPRSYYVLYYFSFIFMVTCVRFFYRIMRAVQEQRRQSISREMKNIMVVGAGEAGAIIVKELQNSAYLTH